MIATDQPRTSRQPRTNGAIDLTEWILRKSRPGVVRSPTASLAIADLFSGCGGLTLGAAEAARRRKLGFRIRLAIDVDPECVSVYARNFDVAADRLVCGSIVDLVPGALGAPLDRTESDLQAHVGRLDLVLAGPPCQGHSDLNNHSRRDDPKNLLYLRAVRFIEVTSPQAAIIENVPAARHDKKQVVQRAAAFLRKLGYHVDYATISLHNLGLPQGRKRLMLIAVKKKDPKALFAKYGQPLKQYSLKEMIGDLEDAPSTAKPNDIFSTPSRMTEVNLRRVEYLFRHNKYDLPNFQRPRCHRDKKHSYKSMYGRLRWDRRAQTITSGFGSMGQGRYVHPSKKRVITPHEAARIQGFPDYFCFRMVEKRTMLQQMIGNAVPPVMAFRPVYDLIADGYLEFTT